MINKLGLLFLVLILSGCANLSDIRRSEPFHTLISGQPPKTIANCVAYESRAATDKWFRKWEPAHVVELDGVFKILVTRLDTGFVLTTNDPMAEIIITPNESGGSKIEYRVFPYWPGKDDFWILVQQCAGKGK